MSLSFRPLRGVLKGLVALILVAAILLLSDLGNRKGREETVRNADTRKVYRMSLVHFVDSPNSEDCEKGTRDYFTEIGWTEGADYTLSVYNAQGDMSALNSIVGTVTGQEWDMIIANSTPTIQALARKGSANPIVFTNVGDPVIAGLGTSYTDHVAGITGVSTMSDFDGMVNLILALQPGIHKIGTVYAPAEINSVAYKEGLEQAAKARGLELVCAAASTTSEVTDAAVSLTTRGLGAVCQISDNLTASCISSIIKAAENARLPMYGFVTKLMSQGVMAVVARDYHQAGYDAGVMVRQILDGTSPAEIPFQLVTRTHFQVSQSLAERYGIRIPGNLTGTIDIMK